MEQYRFDRLADGARTLRLAADNVRSRSPREKYLRDWRLVKRARFNAAKRYERKQSASTLAFAFAGVVGILIPFYTSVFSSGMSVHTKNVLDFTAFVTGALSMMLGFIEQARDYPAKARRFDHCGQGVNRALRRLTLAPGHDGADLHPIVEEYELALKECGENHDEIDFQISVAQQAVEDSPENAERRTELQRLRAREAVQIYGIYWAIWIVPVIMGGALWWAHHPVVQSVAAPAAAQEHQGEAPSQPPGQPTSPGFEAPHFTSRN